MVITYSINTVLGSHRTPSPSNNSAKGLSPPCAPRPPGSVFAILSIFSWRLPGLQIAQKRLSRLGSCKGNFLSYFHPHFYHPRRFMLPAMVT